MKEQLPHKKVPYSLLTTMYSAWQQYKIPAVYYNNLLSILPKLQKTKQILVMTKQIKTLKANTHPYHTIVNAIEARQRALLEINENIGVLLEYENTDQMEWPDAKKDNEAKGASMDLDFGNDQQKNSRSPRYQVAHEDPRSPILSPSKPLPIPKHQTLDHLLNHIALYQRLSLLVVTNIHSWQNELKSLGIQAPVAFLYQKMDYLQHLSTDTHQLLDKYQHLFENNPFLIMKKFHQKSEYAIIYARTRMSQQMQGKVMQCLQILAQYEADVLRWRMLAQVSQTGNKRRKISKSTDIDKIYLNYNNGGDFIVLKDSEAMKKSKIVHQPSLSRIQQQLANKIKQRDDFFNNLSYKQPTVDNRLKSLKKSIIINPEARLMTIDKTVRKHPVQSNLISLVTNKNKQSTPIFIKNPQIRAGGSNERENYFGKNIVQRNQLTKSHPNSQHELDLNLNKLKRSQTEDQSSMKRHMSMVLQSSKEPSQTNKNINVVTSTHQQDYFNNDYSNIRQRRKFQQPISVKPVHGQNQIFVAKKDSNNRQDQIQRNMGLSAQRKIEMLKSVNSERKLNNISYAQQKNIKTQKLKNQLAFESQNLLKSPEKQKPEVKQIKQAAESTSQLPPDTQITLIFEQKLKSTELLKYLRTKIFSSSNTSSQSPNISFEQIQSIAKKLLTLRSTITLIRVETARGTKIAWLAVTFNQKDGLTMRRTVLIHYVRKFVRLSGFQKKLLEKFVSCGYGVIRNQEKILYQVDTVDIVIRPIIKIKYKVAPTADQQQIKGLFKANPALSHSRILKYHSYSKSSKYHRYCNHSTSNCMITFSFLETRRIFVGSNSGGPSSTYIQSKIDHISKLSASLFRISCAVNQTDLVISTASMQQIYALESWKQIEQDSSFDSKCETSYQHLALREGKIMRKYVDEGDDALVCEFVTIGGIEIVQVCSIIKNNDSIEQQAVSNNTLIINPPYFMAIMTKDAGERKCLAVVGFQ